MSASPPDQEAPSRRLPTISGRAPLIGRDDDAEEIFDLFRSGDAPVTVVGPPGVGKTRLAVEVAAMADRRHFAEAEGVWFVPCRDIRGPAELVLRIADVSPVPEVVHSSVDAAIEWIGDHLRDRELFLVLDNLEQATDAARRVLDTWTESPLDGWILTTSRQPLGFDGERTYELSPLSIGDGMALYREVAEDAGLEPDAHDRAQLAELVERLDGLPLSIELAGARAPVIRPQRLVERLDEQLEVLTEPEEDWSAWKHTLRASIRRSWAQLSPPERAGLAQLSVFRGGFGRSSAEAVVDIENPAPDLSLQELIEHLVRRSLAYRERDGDGEREARFVLYEAVRSFASEKLDESDARTSAERRHAQYFADRADHFREKLVQQDWKESLRATGTELSDFFGAYEWGLDHEPVLAARIAGALGQYDVFRPMAAVDSPLFGDVLDRLDAEQSGRTETARIRMRYYLLERRFYTTDFEPDELRPEFESLCRKAKELGDTFTLFHSLRRIVWVHRLEYRQSEALETVERALDHADKWDAERHRANFLVERARGLLKLGRLEETERTLELAERAYRDVHEPLHETDLWGVRTKLELTRCNVDEAIEAGERSLEYARETGDRRRVAFTSNFLGMALLMRGEIERAEQNVELAAAYAQNHGTAFNAAACHRQRGTVHLARKEFGDAVRELEAARRLVRSMDAPTEYYAAVALRAIVAARRGRSDRGEQLLREAREATEETFPIFPVVRAELRLARARSLLENDDVAEAFEACMAARGIAAKVAPEQRETQMGPRTASIAATVARTLFDEASEEFFATHARRFEPLEPSVHVGRVGAKWFQVEPNRPVDLSDRTPLRRILYELVLDRLLRPKEGLETSDLLTAGWPHQEIPTSAGADRVYQAVSELRSLGFGDMLDRDARGYFLRPDVGVRFADEPVE